LTYFTLPNSNQEGKGSPIGKSFFALESFPPHAKNAIARSGESIGQHGPASEWRAAFARPAHTPRERMNFASDNAAGISPEILAAISRANEGAALAYGGDAWTRRVEARFAEVFARDVAVFLVPTGTAANALALAHLTPPWGAVLCHAEAHIMTDECGAPEFYGGGLKLIGLAGQAGKIVPETLRRALDRGQWGGPHHVSPTVLSLSQATEAGTTYRPDEIRQLAEIAHAREMLVHIDGARIGNALARMNASPAQATWEAGVDVLSFGATKGGALAAEAVVFFDPARGAKMPERRKRGGQLISKHRFLAAQIEAYLADDLWLRLARHANAMADRLAAGLVAAQFIPVWPVEANEVFVALPSVVDKRLRAAGASYYPWMTDSLPDGMELDRNKMLVRLVTSFATTADEVDRFVAVASAS
jgi:threonine aldolase